MKNITFHILHEIFQFIFIIMRDYIIEAFIFANVWFNKFECFNVLITPIKGFPTIMLLL